MNIVTVAFYCSRSVTGLAIACHPPNDINRQWTAALGVIEGDEPSFATVSAAQVKVSLINDTESGVIFPLVKNTILQNAKARTCMDTWFQIGHEVFEFSTDTTVLLNSTLTDVIYVLSPVPELSFLPALYRG